MKLSQQQTHSVMLSMFLFVVLLSFANSSSFRPTQLVTSQHTHTNTNYDDAKTIANKSAGPATPQQTQTADAIESIFVLSPPPDTHCKNFPNNLR